MLCTLRRYVANLSACADCWVFCYPNAGLPNAMGGYDQKGPEMAEEVGPARSQILDKPFLTGCSMGSRRALRLHCRCTGCRKAPKQQCERRRSMSCIVLFMREAHVLV